MNESEETRTKTEDAPRPRITLYFVDGHPEAAPAGGR